jgi:hypothetical protein
MPGPAVARQPDSLSINAVVQLAAAAVLRDERDESGEDGEHIGPLVGPACRGPGSLFGLPGGVSRLVGRGPPRDGLLLYFLQRLSHGIHFVLRNLRSQLLLTSVPAQCAHFPLSLSGSLAGRLGGLL